MRTISADSGDHPEGDEIIISGVRLENSGGTIILDFDATLENSPILNNTNNAVFNMTTDGAVLNSGIFISQDSFISFVNGNPPVDLCTPLSEAFVDLNGDGYDDLAMGAIIEVGLADNGGVNIIYGSTSGLTSAGNQIWH
jgi:hypothetical protein